MSKALFSKILFSVVLLLSGIGMSAQTGAYSQFTPYSVFGIGDIPGDGTAFNKSMGGVGIAMRNHRMLNYLNPASLTARDTLSFMADFGLVENNSIYKQGNLTSGKNTFNLNDFIISFPIYRSSAFMIGLVPFSNTGYNFSQNVTDKNLIGNTGNIQYTSDGNGSIYQLFAGGGVTFWNRLSLGAEAIYYFGTVDKSTNVLYTNTSYRDIYSGYKLQLHGITGKFGVQYEQPVFGNVKMTLGATYRLGTKMKGYVTDYSYASYTDLTDTLKNNIDTLRHSGKVKFAGELGVGISFRGGDRWMAELDYTRSDWNKSGINDYNGFANVGESVFSTAVAQSFRGGFEITPNRNDIRYYYRRITYRAGAYYNQCYYKLDGNQVNSVGVTFGATLPVFRWYNGITIGVDLGQRGNTSGNMIRERYATFNIGFNLFDIWFQKQRYE